MGFEHLAAGVDWLVEKKYVEKNFLWPVYLMRTQFFLLNLHNLMNTLLST